MALTKGKNVIKIPKNYDKWQAWLRVGNAPKDYECMKYHLMTTNDELKVFKYGKYRKVKLDKENNLIFIMSVIEIKV